MAVTRYVDATVPLEVGDQFGRYLASYATKHHRVEVHLFETPDHRLTAFVTKSPSVPVAEAHSALRDTIELFTQSLAVRPAQPAQPPTVVYDGYSIGRSGSM